MRALLETICDAALDKKAEDLVEIDVAGRTILADHFVIASGRSRVQTRAIADAMVAAAETAGERIIRVEGYNEGSWILLDFGTIVAHIFTPEQRAFYNLERLWGVVAEQRATGT